MTMKKKFNLSLREQQNLFDQISRRESGSILGGDDDNPQQSPIVNKPPEDKYTIDYDPPRNDFNNKISPGSVSHTHNF